MLSSKRHAESGEMTEREFINIIRRAIEESGVSTVVSDQEVAHRQLDLAVWSEDLEPLIKNPVVIELKTRLRGKGQLHASINQLSMILDQTRTQLGILIYVSSDTHLDEDATNDPRILVFSLEEFLSLMKEHGFGALLRRARNLRVHGVS